MFIFISLDQDQMERKGKFINLEAKIQENNKKKIIYRNL